MTDLAALDIHRHAQDLRGTWQARALGESSGKTTAVMEAVLWHSFAEAMPILMRVVYPSLRLQDGRRYPRFHGTAKIVQSGQVVCALQHSVLEIPHPAVVFGSEGELIKTFRDLGDRLKLPDQERIELIETVKRWVVADLRIDHMGRKLAS